MTAREDLRETSLQMAAGYTLDCVAHAIRLAGLLLAEGSGPWIGRIRDVRPHGETTYHAPLTPLRFPRFTWNTHYVCCAGDLVFDPIAAEPLALSSYGETIFGRPLTIEEFLSPQEVARLVADGTLKAAFRPPVRCR